MDTKTCSVCKIEKHIKNIYRKYSECKDCNRARGLKGYYENKDKLSNHRRIYYEKSRDRILLQKQNNRCIQFIDLVRFYADLENRLKRLKPLEKRVDSENNQIFKK